MKNLAEKLGPGDADLVEGFKYIVIRRGYLSGKPALKDRRISVGQILGNLAEGMTAKELREAYNISAEELSEVLRYAATIADEKKCG